MSLRHARVLLALRDTGNISAAADLLHVTQPAVSKTLAELEQGLGQTLFVRRGRNMQPTPLGRRLLVLAGKLDADLQRPPAMSPRWCAARPARCASVRPTQRSHACCPSRSPR
ncbi:LysR family transcriptional regulator [Mitsuaria sp. TWR114]|nr:LysR family transcriptional regulator [Mitsuaria sp. TWR114]